MSMSRVGRKPIKIPSGVEIKLQDGTLFVKGPKGKQDLPIHPFVQLEMDNQEIKVQANKTDKKLITGANAKLARSIVGTIRANIQNTVQGVTVGFERRLLLQGVGYRAQLKGKMLSLSLGYSHPTEFSIPDEITIETPTQTEIVIKGINKRIVGLVASKIRRIRSPEPYKGKGIRYAKEVIVLKETKKK